MGKNDIHNPLIKADFERAHFRSFLYDLMARLSGGQRWLLSLDAVRRVAKPHAESYEGLRTIPVSLIVGSEGRYQDFDKRFLPKNPEIRARWENVDRAHYDLKELPPIQVYEIGDLYFVKDGNHRVSVARERGVEFIDAEVIKLHADVTLDPEKNIWLQLLEYERKQFYDQTKLRETRPQCRIQVSDVGSYDLLLRHIEVHEYLRNEKLTPAPGMVCEIKNGSSNNLPCAARVWYDQVYRPIVLIMREQRIMKKFSERTEADLYLWVMDHWHYLKEEYGPFVQPEVAVASFANRFGQSPWRRLRRRLRRFLGGGSSSGDTMDLE